MKPSITLTVFITCGFFLISGCGDDAGENHASGPPPKGDPIVGEPIQPVQGNSTIAETEGLLGPKDNPSNTKPSLPVEGEEVSVVEGEIASVGTPDDPFVAPKEKEIVELPFPPGTDANASTVNIPEPVVSLLPPLPKGSGYAPLSFASMSKFTYEVDWEKDGMKFDLSAFAHDARWNEAAGRIEMHLVSQRDQIVNIADNAFNFQADETIHTENSHKYGLTQFTDMAERAGWDAATTWTDPDKLFSVHFLRAR